MDRCTLLWSHDAVFPARATSASRARDLVGRWLLEHGLPDLMDDVRLVVSELATNALMHAQTPFTVTLQACATSVLLTVQDGSPSVPVRVAAASLGTGGRGVTIVELLSRDWGVTADTAGGKSVWASFDPR